MKTGELDRLPFQFVTQLSKKFDSSRERERGGEGERRRRGEGGEGERRRGREGGEGENLPSE
ncbi:MAG: hypothetical protein EAZ19_26985 [Oscillatoriales cyanobacterium]|nr:MAG: hypothetical protein EAZ25_01115 [Oscillatoriales cyanobacterium]TAG70699.1 MAG: hypothetical protein EAZ23_21470 [Oscillatoriales cyanobacterium]TAG87517.1 MAG: hypothetical protein EAZ19_26985 [Oscillatoriales cyanobacterium]